MERKCYKCGEVKDISEFRVVKEQKNGKVYTIYKRCLDCERKYNHEYYLKYIKKKKEAEREERNKNITMVQARQLMEMVAPLAKGCAFTNLEFMQIANICNKCIDRVEGE